MSASKKYADRSRQRRGIGKYNQHKGNRQFHAPCKVKGCLLGADHRGVCYFGID